MRHLLLLLPLVGCTLDPLNETEKSTEEDPYPNGYTIGELVIDPGTLDFGNVDPNDTKTEELLFVNTGGSTLSVVSASIDGDSAFTLESSFLNFDIDPEGEEIVNVRFTPAAEQAYSASLSVLISTESSAGEVEITGLGGNAQSGEPSGEPSEDPVEGGLSVSETEKNFGQISLNSTATFVVDVTNESDAPISITGVSSTDSAFEISPYSNVQEGEAISAGITRTMTINFKPTEEITYQGTLTLETDSPDTPELDFTLSGEGIYQCQICAPKVMVNGNGVSPIKSEEFVIGLDLNTFQTNPNPMSKTMTISNGGDEELVITAFNINNDPNPPSDGQCGTDGEFTVLNANLPITLAPYDTQTGQMDSIDLSVQFAYAGTESQCFDCVTPFLGVNDDSTMGLLPTTTMEVLSNDPNGAFTVFLGGTVSGF